MRCASIPICGFLAAAVFFGGLVPSRALPVVHRKHAPKVTNRKTIEELEDQWRLAQLNGDAAAMDRLLSEDFVGITASGQMNTKAQQLARLRSHALSLTMLDLTDIKVKLVGQVAIVTSRAEINGTSDGAPLGGMFRYTRVYQRLPGGVWKITSFEATRIPNSRAHTEAETSSATPPATP